MHVPTNVKPGHGKCAYAALRVGTMSIPSYVLFSQTRTFSMNGN